MEPSGREAYERTDASESSSLSKRGSSLSSRMSLKVSVISGLTQQIASLPCLFATTRRKMAQSLAMAELHRNLTPYSLMMSRGVTSLSMLVCTCP